MRIARYSLTTLRISWVQVAFGASGFGLSKSKALKYREQIVDLCSAWKVSGQCTLCKVYVRRMGIVCSTALCFAESTTARQRRRSVHRQSSRYFVNDAVLGDLGMVNRCRRRTPLSYAARACEGDPDAKRSCAIPSRHELIIACIKVHVLPSSMDVGAMVCLSSADVIRTVGPVPLACSSSNWQRVVFSRQSEGWSKAYEI